jgi:hypothetical protein
MPQAVGTSACNYMLSRSLKLLLYGCGVIIFVNTSHINLEVCCWIFGTGLPHSINVVPENEQFIENGGEVCYTVDIVDLAGNPTTAPKLCVTCKVLHSNFYGACLMKYLVLWIH